MAGGRSFSHRRRTISVFAGRVNPCCHTEQATTGESGSPHLRVGGGVVDFGSGKWPGGLVSSSRGGMGCRRVSSRKRNVGNWARSPRGVPGEFKVVFCRRDDGHAADACARTGKKRGGSTIGELVARRGTAEGHAVNRPAGSFAAPPASLPICEAALRESGFPSGSLGTRDNRPVNVSTAECRRVEPDEGVPVPARYPLPAPRANS